MATIRVLLVDDQEIVRQGLATILAYTPGIQVVGQAADGQQAIALAHSLRPDVVLMDLKMPGLGGIPATRSIVAELPDVRVIILTTYDADDLVFEGIVAGARGYLLKDTSGEELAEAIRGVMRNEAQLAPQIAGKVMAEFRRMAEQAKDQPSRSLEGSALILEPLTAREEEVLHLLVEGLANKQIAAALGLSEGTVRNHVSTIIAKLQANDRTHAVVTAIRHGLVDPYGKKRPG